MYIDGSRNAYLNLKMINEENNIKNIQREMYQPCKKEVKPGLLS